MKEKNSRRFLAILLAFMLLAGSLQMPVYATEDTTEAAAGQSAEEEQSQEEVYAEEEGTSGCTTDVSADDSDDVFAEETEEEGEAESADKARIVPEDESEAFSQDEAYVSYNVILDANGGRFENVWDDAIQGILESAEVLNRVFSAGKAIDVFPIYEKENQTIAFQGWSLEREGELVSHGYEDFYPAGDCILYAVWEEAEDSKMEREEDIKDEDEDRDRNIDIEEFQSSAASDDSAQNESSSVEDETQADIVSRETEVDPEESFPAEEEDQEEEEDPEGSETVRQDPVFGIVEKKAVNEKDLRIETQPENIIADYGARVSLEIHAEGEELRYQWYYRDSEASDWEPMQSRKESFYYITLNEAWDGRNVMCRVSDKAGHSVDSQPASVTVLPTINTMTATPKLELGEAYTLSVTAHGKGLSYQWYYKMAGDSEWMRWEGKTHAEEPIIMQAEYDGMYHNCVVTAANGYSISTYDWHNKHFFWSDPPRITLKESMDPSVEEYSLYSISEGFQQYLDFPGDRLQSYSLKGHTYKILTGDSVTIEDDIVHPKEEIWYYHQLSSGYWAGSTYPSGTEGEIAQKSYKYGDTVVRIDDERNITFHSISYETEYAQQVADKYLAEHVDTSMSEYEQAKQCCIFVAGYDYGTNTSGMTGMILSGSGDCWASTDTLLYMLEKLGISSDSRYAGYESGAGSGHYNVIAKLDGAYYILDAGYNETAPRYYRMSAYGSPFSYSNVTNEAIKITAYIDLDQAEEIQIPSVIDGKTVVGIGNGGMSGISSVKKIILPDTIRSIENNAFNRDSSLEEVDIPEGVRTLGTSAFSYCSSLKTVTLPSSIEEIGTSCFIGCTGLESIHVQEGNQFFEEKDGMLLRCGGAELVAFPPGKRGACMVPDGVKTLEKYSFAFSCPDSISLPRSLRVIEPYAFYHTSMKYLSLPQGITEVGDQAFARSGISEIDIPDTVVSIGEEAFFHGVNKIQLPEGLKYIGQGAFAGDISLGRTIIPSSVVSIGDYAFYLDYGWSSMGEKETSKSDNLVLFSSGSAPEFSGDNVFHDCVIGATAGSTAGTYAKDHELLFLETDEWNKIKLQDGWFGSLDNNFYFYTGEARRPAVTVKSGEGACPLELEEMTDFRSEYKNNKDAGEAMVILKGIGAFSGNVERPFTIGKGYQQDFKVRLEKEEISKGHKTSIHVENAIGDVTYEVWRESIASVDQEGTVTGKNAGTTTIYVTSGGDNNYHAQKLSVKITVTQENHIWDGGEVTKEPSCTEEGTKTWICKECGTTKTEAISATGHSPVIDAAVAAACTKDGLTEGSHCAVCGKVLQKQETVPMTGHAWDAGSVTRKATCVQKGVRTFTCKNNAAHTKTEEIPVDPDNHTGKTEIRNAKEATCIGQGYTGDTHCADCGSLLSKGKSTKQKAHTWDKGKVTTAPSCTAAGTKTFTCTACGTTKTEAVPATGHSFGEWVLVTPPTALEEGLRERTCASCGESEKEAVAKLPPIPFDSRTSISLSATSFTYTGTAVKPAVTVKDGNITLVSGTEYTVSYSNNINAGTATVTVTGKGGYTGTKTVDFKINKASQTIAANASAAAIDLGRTATVSLSGAQGTISYRSSDPSIATVDLSTGVVTGIKTGTVTITATSAATANYNEASTTITITVRQSLKKPGNCHFVKWNNAKYNSCQIAWNKVAGADGYQTVLSWTDGSHSTKKYLKPNELSQNCTVAVNHVSQLTVRAFINTESGPVYGPWSNVEYITPSPATFKYKKAGTSNKPKVKISWNIIYGCNGYNVFVTTNPKGAWYWNQSTDTKATETSATITSYRGSKLKKGTKYYVRIVTRRKRNGVFCTVPMPSSSTYIGSFKIK